VGPPGHGKTRLALEFARGEAEKGVAVLFIDLTEVAGAEDLALRLADAADLAISDDACTDTFWTQVGKGLHQRGIGLLILDNFEHLVEACREPIETLHRGLEQTRLLITSRERLGLRAERRLLLEHLPLPGEDAAAIDNAAIDNAAIALFADRAGVVTPPDLRCIARIVHHLEGNPLGIELCATRAQVIGHAALLRELEKGMDVISGRHVPEAARFRSLSGALEHSWSLASEPERAALARFSVFRGGFDLDAARALWPDRSESILDILELLRDRSLLRISDAHASAGRHALYESVREFAARFRSDEPVDVEALHAAHFLQEPVTVEAMVTDPLAPAEFERRLAESGNLLCIHRDAMAASPPRVDQAIQALLRLRPLYLARGPFGEIAAMVEETLAACPDRNESDVALALVMLSELEARRGRFERSVDVLERVRARLGQDEPVLSAYTHMLLGSRLAYVFRRTEALEAFARAEALTVTLEQPALAARLHQELATLMMLLDMPEAERKLESALFYFRRSGSVRGQSQVLGYLAACRLSRGALDAAEQAARESIALCAPLGDRRWTAHAFMVIGCVMRERGALGEARERLEESLETFRSLDNHWLEALALTLLGELAIERDDLVEASRAFERALELERPRGDRISIAWALAGVATVSAREDRISQAERALAEAMKIAERLGFRTLIEAVGLRRAEIEIARARRLAADGDRAGATSTLAGLDLREAQRGGQPYAVRVTARVIARELERAGGALLPSLTLAEDAAWFEVGSAARVSLARRAVLRRLLRRLALERLERPGGWLSTEALFAAGWPAERAIPASAANRVHVSLSRLRKLGLSDFLERGAAGLRLRPEAMVSMRRPRARASRA